MHLAPIPHEPGHGSLHFWLMQAILLEQSEFITHSGLQFGGFPIKVGKQAQDGLPPISLHSELGPHGVGTQGFCSVMTGETAAKSYLPLHLKYF